MRNEAIRETVEREEDYKRELAQTIEEKDAELAALARTHATELARVTAEKDAQIIALQQAVKAADVQRQSAEEQVIAVRQTLKTVQREAAELKERVSALEVDKQSADEALARERLVIESLQETQRQQSEELEVAAAEIRRNASERRKFVAYLEEGLALLGALPPTAEHADEPDDDQRSGPSGGV